ncbi:unnamed protein product [Amoebophrya sp. A25]|nr:unnamed protein product [Amoebophrya sp. A25]|eukprot:GSA25T00019866001.1
MNLEGHKTTALASTTSESCIVDVSSADVVMQDSTVEQNDSRTTTTRQSNVLVEGRGEHQQNFGLRNAQSSDATMSRSRTLKKEASERAMASVGRVMPSVSPTSPLGRAYQKHERAIQMSQQTLTELQSNYRNLSSAAVSPGPRLRDMRTKQNQVDGTLATSGQVEAPSSGVSNQSSIVHPVQHTCGAGSKNSKSAQRVTCSASSSRVSPRNRTRATFYSPPRRAAVCSPRGARVSPSAGKLNQRDIGGNNHDLACRENLSHNAPGALVDHSAFTTTAPGPKISKYMGHEPAAATSTTSTYSSSIAINKNNARSVALGQRKVRTCPQSRRISPEVSSAQRRAATRGAAREDVGNPVLSAGQVRCDSIPGENDESTHPRGDGGGSLLSSGARQRAFCEENSGATPLQRQPGHAVAARSSTLMFGQHQLGQSSQVGVGNEGPRARVFLSPQRRGGAPAVFSSTSTTAASSVAASPQNSHIAMGPLHGFRGNGPARGQFNGLPPSSAGGRAAGGGASGFQATPFTTTAPATSRNFRPHLNAPPGANGEATTTAVNCTAVSVSGGNRAGGPRQTSQALPLERGPMMSTTNITPRVMTTQLPASTLGSKTASLTSLGTGSQNFTTSLQSNYPIVPLGRAQSTREPAQMRPPWVGKRP